MNIGPPAIVISEDTKYARINDTVELICNVSSNPDSSISWFHDDKLIKQTTPLESLNSITDRKLGDSVLSKLSAQIKSKSEYGHYRCQAINNFGISQKAIELKEKSKSS